MERVMEVGVAGLIPIYQPEFGNATKLIMRDGKNCIDRRTIKTVLKGICRYYTIHIESCREKYGKMVNQRLGVPILINRRLLFIPLKMRKPKFPKDGAHGYVNLYDILDMREDNGLTVIRLKSGVEVTCLHRMRTVQQHINQGKIVGATRDHMKDDCGEFFNQYNRPATKEDIARIQKEILELRDIMKKVLVQKT